MVEASAEQITELASGLRFPEGPVAMPDGSLLIVEIARGTLTRIASDGTTTVVAKPGGGPNGLAIGPDGRGYICNNGGFDWIEEQGILRPAPVVSDQTYSGGRIERVDLASGAVELLCSGSAAGPLNGPNDIVFDSEGGFWFTDLGKYRERKMDRGAVYYAKADGSFIQRVVFPMVTPNGIGLSPDGKRLYVAESQTARLWAFDIIAPGQLRKKPWPSPNGGDLVIGLAGYQIFDSLAVEADGRVCIGTLITGGITVVSPDGSQCEFVALPDPLPTNICFGGGDLKTAFITLSGSGKLVSLPWPRPGLPLNYVAFG
ncbi:SMP-30/gluconolactonase/LRE family protein [Pelagibius sp.]|uniref:SMP-30/gluconolactonase/LRE family protein n=1 Tax=Pelagibius sp. TaxID=1931238 RepID=UPI003BAE3464